MTQKQQNRLSMYKTVADHLNKNTALWQAFKPFAAAATGLQQVIEGLDGALQQQKSATSTGATADKANLSTEAIQQVLYLARNAAAYAMAINNMELYTQLHHSRTYLERLPDNEQIAKMQAMLGRIREHAAELADYMITPDAIAEAQTAIDAAVAVLVRPRTLLDMHSAATGSIPSLLASGRHYLAVLDKLIHNYTEAQPDFVANYRQARIIVERGTRHENEAAAQNDDQPQ